LLEVARSSRRYLALAVGAGAATAMVVVLQAWLLADVVSGAVDRHRDLAALAVPLGVLLVVVVVRAALAWASERLAQRSAARATSEMRRALTDAIAEGRVDTGHRGGTGALLVLASSGVDALQAYFGRYLPQLVLAVVVPVTVIAFVAGVDPVSALIIAVTVPLIPVFISLVGASTAARTRRQMRTLQRLAGHFLDVVEGLPTLKVFGRAQAQVAAVRAMTDRYRVATMATLRVAFLSSLILELLATISVALVAVAVGLRLLGGHLHFEAALFVLVLAPEAYLPLRLLGGSFHDSAEGLQAAHEVFAALDAPAAPGTWSGPGARTGAPAPLPVPARSTITVTDVEVTYPGRARPALAAASLTLDPGEVVALTGPSGCGKSTLLGVLLGLVLPDSGTVRIGGAALADLDRHDWYAHLAWVPQRPHLFARSIADNVRLGRPDAAETDVRAALEVVGLDAVVDGLPDGIETVLGDRGTGLSAGQRQRVALARAVLRDAPLLLLDEPTANLDGRSEEEVLEALGQVIGGRTVLVVAHRPALAALADRRVALAPEPALP
jgi:thiol reductant ABC exporter CydD subunit